MRGKSTVAAAVAIVVGFSASGCRSSAPPPTQDPTALAEAVDALHRPLSGDMAALYHLRVPTSGGLRLSIVQKGTEGRLTISEPFGAAVSMAAWGGPDKPRFLDLRQGCRVPGTDSSAVFGVRVMPLPQAVRLLGGRMPAVDTDRVLAGEGGRLEIAGDGWSAWVTVAAQPWRITAVEQVTAGGVSGWKVRLDDHSGSVPGWIRVKGANGRWAELKLVRLQWDTVGELPPLPSLPVCDHQARGER